MTSSEAKNLRMSLQLTQLQVSYGAGISQSSYSTFENAKANLAKESMQKLEAFFAKQQQSTNGSAETAESATLAAIARTPSADTLVSVSATTAFNGHQNTITDDLIHALAKRAIAKMLEPMETILDEIISEVKIPIQATEITIGELEMFLGEFTSKLRSETEFTINDILEAWIE